MFLFKIVSWISIITVSLYFHWIGVIILSLLFLYIIFIVYIYMVDRNRLNKEYQIKIFDNGVEVFSNKQGKINFYSYKDIAAIRVLNTHPLSYSALVLKNKNIIYLFATPSTKFIHDIQKKNLDITIECEEGSEWRVRDMDITPIIVKEGIY